MGTPKTCTMTELRKNLGSILDDVSNGAIYAITRYGKIVAYLVPPSWIDNSDEATQQRAEDKAAKNKAGILASGADYEVGGEG